MKSKIFAMNILKRERYKVGFNQIVNQDLIIPSENDSQIHSKKAINQHLKTEKLLDRENMRTNSLPLRKPYAKILNLTKMGKTKKVRQNLLQKQL